jgi:hypothetical protein
LDSQSTVDVFSNAMLLKDIHESESSMKIHCTAGVTATNLVGTLPGYGTVWYHPTGIANILSLARVCKAGYDVSYSSSNGNTFIVTKPDGSVRNFKQSDEGLFYLDTNLNARNGGTMLITTVADNQYKYSNRDYSRASLARKIQRIIGRPSTQQFLYILRHNLLPNCPIQPRDVVAADDIFGPDMGSLKGKQVRENPDPVETIITEIPTTLYERYRNVTIAIDIMYVNKIAFFVTISRDIRFATSEMIPDAQVTTIMKVIEHALNVYKTRNFKVTHILADGQFEHLSNEIASLGAMPNIVA